MVFNEQNQYLWSGADYLCLPSFPINPLSSFQASSIETPSNLLGCFLHELPLTPFDRNSIVTHRSFFVSVMILKLDLWHDRYDQLSIATSVLQVFSLTFHQI